MKNRFHASGHQKKTGIAIFISNRHETKNGNKHTRFCNSKGSIHQEDIIIANVCAPKIRISKHIEPILKDLKGE